MIDPCWWLQSQERDKRKRALSGASLAAAMANHQHVLFDDEGVGRSPRSVAAKARWDADTLQTCICHPPALPNGAGKSLPIQH